MRKIYLFVLFGLFIVLGLSSQTNLSIGDFIVRSDNPDYKYIGKGISQLIAGELRRDSRYNIIERERINEIIDEQKLSLNGLISETDMINIGQLLSADFILMGEIVDMGGSLLFSLRLVDSTTAMVVWQDDAMKKLSAYDYIKQYFAQSLKAHFSQSGLTLEIVTGEQEERNETLVVELSKGLNAYDNKDIAEAKKALGRARAIDPKNDTVKYYQNLLSGSTAKFHIISEPYFYFRNPAYLGELTKDQITYSTMFDVFHDNDSMVSESPFSNITADWLFNEDDSRTYFSYSLPLIPSRWGLGMHYIASSRRDRFTKEGETQYRSTKRGYQGGVLAMGWGGDSVSLGTSASVFYTNNGGGYEAGSPYLYESVDYSFEGGALYHRDDFLTLGLRLGWSSTLVEDFDTDIFNMQIIENDKTYRPVPFFWENSVLISFKNNRTFLSINQNNDIYYDTGGAFIRLLPVTEHYFTPWFSLRGGIEGVLSISEGKSTPGYGLVGGLTFHIPHWDLDFDANISYRQRPSRIDNTLLYTEMPVSFSLTKEGVFFRK